MTTAPLLVQFMRHGRVAHHRGDVPLTELGLQEAEAAAERVVADVQRGEIVMLLHTATLRSRETACALERIMRAHPQIPPDVVVCPPREEEAIRNPDLYIGGMRVEMVSTAEAMAEQTAAIGLPADAVGSLPFYRSFFGAHDRIGYWVQHPDPPGEDANAVARRMMAFAVSLRDRSRDRPTRYLCVTHSPLMRAFLGRYVFVEDPGEPEFMEWIDLNFAREGAVTLRYRDHEIVHALPSDVP